MTLRLEGNYFRPKSIIISTNRFFAVWLDSGYYFEIGKGESQNNAMRLYFFESATFKDHISIYLPPKLLNFS